MSDLVVLVDYYNFTVAPAWQGARPTAETLNKGDSVDGPDGSSGLHQSILGYDREVARGLALKALGDRSVLEQRVSLVAMAPPPISVERLAEATPEELAQMQADAQEAVMRRSVAMGQMPSGVYSDEQLSKMGAEELAAVVNQFPSELPRILAIEQQRGAKARKTVLALDPGYQP